jgi:hypothetical protein
VLFTTSNWRANASFLIATVIAAGVALLSGLLYLILARALRRPWVALEVTSALVIAFWHWNSFASDFGVGSPWLIGLGLTCLLVVFAVRFADHRYLRVGAFATSLTLLLAGTAVLISLAIQTPPTSIQAAAPVDLGSPQTKPDIYLLVVDGYAREDVLLSDYGFDNGPFIDGLREQGFFVADRSTANYSGTHFSIANVLSMDYVGDEGPDVSVSDLRRLGEIIGGDNPAVDSLKAAGYTYVHGASDWWGNDCGPKADVCMQTPLIDITAYDLLAQTPLRGLLYRETGDPGTKIAMTRLQQFRGEIPGDGLTGEGPRFVFMHVLVPHPPLFLDAECQPRLGEQYAQRRLNSYPALPAEIVEIRKDGYLEQVKCANLMIQALVDSVPEDAVVLVMSDHGPDSRSQIALPAETWDASATTERFGNLMALRTPCNDEADPGMDAVNVLRFTFRCIFDADLPDLDGRYLVVPSARYTGPLTEVPDPNEGFS